VPTDVTSSPVVLTSGGVPLAGRVHRAAGATGRQPGVVVSGSWLTVKEQMADLYAARLAARGFTTLTFDFAGWGASGGDLRHAELPTRKVADIAAATAFLRTSSLVWPGGVGYVGVCASAQYALAAAALGAPIRSLAAVAGWFHDAASVAPFYGGGAGVADRLARSDAATDAFLRTGEVATVPAYGTEDEGAAMTLAMAYYAEPDRGAVPSWPNRMAELSWRPWLTFDGLAAAGGVDVPALFVHADGCVFPDNVRRLARELPGPVTVAWGDGGQTDFYDRPEQVGFALDALDDHLRTTLAPDQEGPA
jgi:dienelactone hydrolase